MRQVVGRFRKGPSPFVLGSQRSEQRQLAALLSSTNRLSLLTLTTHSG
ncbi:MAG: hypothetical protein RI978_76 [Verrucomicrobiota bacterium]